MNKVQEKEQSPQILSWCCTAHRLTQLPPVLQFRRERHISSLQLAFLCWRTEQPTVTLHTRHSILGQISPVVATVLLL